MYRLTREQHKKILHSREAEVPTDLRYFISLILMQPIDIPKGTQCSYCPFIMQRNVEIFGPTANNFEPERWANWSPVPWTYIPFNGGPRICLGQNFALTEIAYATARMCQSFVRIEERSGMPRSSQGYRTDIILTPLRGVKIGLIPVS